LFTFWGGKAQKKDYLVNGEEEEEEEEDRGRIEEWRERQEESPGASSREWRAS